MQAPYPTKTDYDNYNRADWRNIISKLNDVNWELAIDKIEPDAA